MGNASHKLCEYTTASHTSTYILSYSNMRAHPTMRLLYM